VAHETIQGYRLSPQQTRLWLAEQSGARRSYCLRSLIELEGKLDQAILRQALDHLISQHEILRSSFQLLPGMTIPLQVIADQPLLPLQSDDLSTLGTTQQREKIEQLFCEAGASVGYPQPLLLGTRLLKLSDTRHLLLITASALCIDGPSVTRLLLQLAAAYEELRRGEAPKAIDAMQYADFAEWQNELLESSAAATALEYWPPGNLPGLGPRLIFENRGNQTESSFATLPVEIKNATRKQIEAVVESCGTSPATFLLACWQTLLWRSTTSKDITVKVLFEGRKFAELEQAIGLLSSYLPISSHFDERLSLTDLLGRLTVGAEEASRLQEYYRPEQSRTDNDRAFCFEAREWPAPVQAAELKFSLARHEPHTEAFKIKLVCERKAEGFSASLQYDESRFSSPDMKLIAERLATLIDAAAIAPRTALAELDVVGPKERQLILFAFNNTNRYVPGGQCIHDLFAEQAARTPDRVAVIFEDEQLTFAALNARANELAHRLQLAGVGPDVAVGLCFDRSLDLIVGLLGILKAGGAYVPLDPGLPKSRLSLMLAEAGARVLVTRNELANGLEVDHVVLVEATLPEIPGQFAGPTRNEKGQHHDLLTENPVSLAGEQNLAYIIFTSGSTGKPKGVAVEHRQLRNYVAALWEKLELADASSFATVSTIAADLGNTVLFPPLLKGGTLHLISEERSTNPDALANYCRRYPIDCLKIVPSHLSALLSAAQPADLLPRLRLVLGGEACSWNLVEQVSTLAPECAILNHYGPTETTVGATTQRVDLRERGLTEVVPLGRPLAHAHVLILDQHQQPAPLGVPGELHIGGAGVARGYIGRPEATAEKFIPDPFIAEPGSRLYKTGDLARQLADGRLEFLGRIDDQVKIHGYRIEPVEIAQALREHPSVGEAIVVAREDHPGEKRLVAYIVARTGAQIEGAELKTFLQGRLPEYMIPRSIMRLESLPLTRNGKVDRSALPPPDRFQADEAATVLPRNEVEEVLASIWSRVLGVERLGIHDNFFELGGDSILSIQIIAKANQAGLKLSPRQLFEHQTIAGLAGVAGTAITSVAEQGTVTGEVPLTPVQARFFALEPADPHHYNQAMLLEVDTSLDPEVLQRALAGLQAHHDALRLRFKRTELGWQQAIVPLESHNGISLEVFRGPVTEERATALQASLNLEKGPLLRAALFTDQNEVPVRLLLVIHHLLVDGVSWSVLLEDLQTIYEQIESGKRPQPPAKTTSFKSWAEQLAAHARTEALLAEAPYWVSLSDAAVARLPVDFRTGPNNSASARTVTRSLDPRETMALLMEVPAAYRTQINETLLTALAQTLSQWTNSSAILLDLEGHGREEIFPGADLSRTVGWFTTIFPVLLDLKKSQGLGESLRLVKEQLRAIPQRGIGYGLLRFLSGKKEIVEALGRQSPAEVRFNYLGQTDRVLSQASLFKPCAEATGPAQTPAAQRGYLLNIIGAVTDGELRLEWTYSENIHRRDTIEQLAETYLMHLRTLISNARAADATSISPTDFPRARLNQTELNKVLKKLGR